VKQCGLEVWQEVLILAGKSQTNSLPYKFGPLYYVSQLPIPLLSVPVLSDASETGNESADN